MYNEIPAETPVVPHDTIEGYYVLSKDLLISESDIIASPEWFEEVKEESVYVEVAKMIRRELDRRQYNITPTNLYVIATQLHSLYIINRRSEVNLIR